MSWASDMIFNTSFENVLDANRLNIEGTRQKKLADILNKVSQGARAGRPYVLPNFKTTAWSNEQGGDVYNREKAPDVPWDNGLGGTPGTKSNNMLLGQIAAQNAAEQKFMAEQKQVSKKQDPYKKEGENWFRNFYQTNYGGYSGSGGSGGSDGEGG